MLRTLWNFAVPRLYFIGGIIDAIGKNVKEDIRMSREKSNQWQTSRQDHLANVDWERAQIARNQDREFWHEQFTRAESHANREIRDRVIDAKAAGVHPLFALGTPSSFSPTPTRMGNTYSGSGPSSYRPPSSGGYTPGVGSAIDQFIAGRERKQRQSGMDARLQRMQDAQIRNLDSRSALNEIEAMRRSSDTAMNMRDPWDTGTGRSAGAGGSAFEPHAADLGVGSAEARTFPADTVTRVPQKRPVTQESRRSSPYREEVIGQDGERYMVVNSKYDELAQADLLYQTAVRKLYRAMWAAKNARERKTIAKRIKRLKQKARYKFGRRIQ